MTARKIIGCLFDGVLLGLIVIVFALAMLAVGCRHAPCPEPVAVDVPVDNAGAELPLAELPEWRTPGANPANPTEYIRALAHDLLAAWAVITEDRDTISDHNSTIASDPE